MCVHMCIYVSACVYCMCVCTVCVIMLMFVCVFKMVSCELVSTGYVFSIVTKNYKKKSINV